LILSSYLGVEPAQLIFSHDPCGKPQIDPDQNTTGLRFNMAHAERMALIAVSQRDALGVDLEFIRDLDDLAGLAGRCFSPREKADFNAIPPTGRNEHFFKHWVCKEAWLKALGRGVAAPLESFALTFVDGRPKAVTTDGSQDDTVSVELIAPFAQFVGAVVTVGPPKQLQFLRFARFDAEMA
jgi:4'-phosphopantetheinyl transferase